MRLAAGRHFVPLLAVSAVVSAHLVGVAPLVNAAQVPNGDFSSDLTGWTIVTAGSNPADYVNLGVTSLAGCTSTDFQNYTDVQSFNRGTSPPAGYPTNDDDTPVAATFSASVVTTDPVSGTANAGRFLYLASSMTTGAYDVVHGPAAVSAEFTAATNDVINFRWYAKEVRDNFAVVAYLQKTGCSAQQQVLSATGDNPGSMLPAGTGGNVWQTAQVVITSPGTYRFVFVSGTHDQTGGTIAGADLYIADISSGQPQTISFTNPGTQTVGTPLDLGATASSNLPVSYASTTQSVCTVSGSRVTFLTSGTCSITASQAGNSTYAAAPNVTQSFTVNKVAPTITYNGQTTGTVGSPLTYSSTLGPGVCTGALTYTLDRNPTTGASGSYTLTGSPINTNGWQAGAYTLTTSYGGSASCLSGTLATSITVENPASPSPGPQYTIILDGNRGTCLGSALTGEQNSWVELPTSGSCTRPGYELIGWNTSIDGSGLGYTPGSRVELTGDSTLYAQWRVVTPISAPTPNGSSGTGKTPENNKSSRQSRSATVFFNTDSAVLTDPERATLRALVNKTGKQVIRVVTVGYVQESSTNANDAALSLARARSVNEYLRSLGVRGKYVGRGDGISGPRDPDRRARVTIVFRK